MQAAALSEECSKMKEKCFSLEEECSSLRAKELDLLEALRVSIEERAVTDSELLEERNKFILDVQVLNLKQMALTDELHSMEALYLTASTDLDAFRIQHIDEKKELQERDMQFHAANEQIQLLREQLNTTKKEVDDMRGSESATAAADASAQAADRLLEAERYDSLSLEYDSSVGRLRKASEMSVALKEELKRTSDSLLGLEEAFRSRGEEHLVVVTEYQEDRRISEERFTKQIIEFQLESSSARAELATCLDDLDTKVAEVGSLNEIIIEVQSQTTGLLDRIQELEVTARENEKMTSALTVRSELNSSLELQLELERGQHEAKLAEQRATFDEERTSAVLTADQSSKALENLRGELAMLQKEFEMKVAEVDAGQSQLDLSIQDMSVLREESTASQSQVASIHVGIGVMKDQLHKTAAKFIDKIRTLKAQVSLSPS